MVRVRVTTKKKDGLDSRIQVRFTPEEIAAAKKQMRQLGMGTLGDYVRWVLRDVYPRWPRLSP